MEQDSPYLQILRFISSSDYAQERKEQMTENVSFVDNATEVLNAYSQIKLAMDILSNNQPAEKREQFEQEYNISMITCDIFSNYKILNTKLADLHLSEENKRRHLGDFINNLVGDTMYVAKKQAGIFKAQIEKIIRNLGKSKFDIRDRSGNVIKAEVILEDFIVKQCGGMLKLSSIPTNRNAVASYDLSNAIKEIKASCKLF